MFMIVIIVILGLDLVESTPRFARKIRGKAAYCVYSSHYSNLRSGLDCTLGWIGSGFSTCNPTTWQPTGSGRSGFTSIIRSGLVNSLSISEPKLTLLLL